LSFFLAIYFEGRYNLNNKVYYKEAMMKRNEKKNKDTNNVYSKPELKKIVFKDVKKDIGVAGASGY
jgi:hypothetical protein